MFDSPEFIGDTFGESLGGSQAPPSLWTVPGLLWKFPELPRKFPSNFPGTSHTVELSGTSVWRPQSRYTMSRIECRTNIPQNQRCRAKIALHPPNQLSLSHSQQAGVKGGCAAADWWRVSRYFCVPKTYRATGGCRSYSPHQSRYSLQLSCGI